MPKEKEAPALTAKLGIIMIPIIGGGDSGGKQSNRDAPKLDGGPWRKRTKGGVHWIGKNKVGENNILDSQKTEWGKGANDLANTSDFPNRKKGPHRTPRGGGGDMFFL